MVVSRARSGIIAEPWIRGAPDIVIEILSPTTAHRDSGIKLQLNQRQGVAQYWIVDLEADTVEVWTFGEEPALERFTKVLPVQLGGEPVGEIDLAGIFRAD